ncbi:hypothetical protein MKQ70_17510 [Chitinophaga sedimenti]|uniref:hypothetical protein n=1 Tax=Chitinophaga sedimenti TaxID=2033606 RepID=UPI002006001E|nr:hypothetical protein [Chitinophaga sedimenti]MCK7556718.1 hypothetical protein [Chitinophaga sedimenti]
MFSKHFDHPAGNYKRAKYTMIVHTTFIEPGFNVGVMRKSARIDTEITLVDASNKELVKFTVDNTPVAMRWVLTLTRAGVFLKRMLSPVKRSLNLSAKSRLIFLSRFDY